MQNKKVIILAVLGIGATASLIYGIVTPPQKTSRIEQKREAVSYGDRKEGPSTAPAQVKRRAARTKFASWKRRPFVPAGVPGKSSDLALSGILGAGANLKAMIGDAVVGKGDRVGNNTVIDIKKDRVILNDGTKDFELKLEQ